MKKILVTGANGFLGRQVLLPLRERGFEVHAVGRVLPPAELADLAVWHTADLLQPESVRNLLRQLRPEGLMHLAWDTTPGTYWTNPTNLDWAAASLFLLSEFQRNGGRRVVAAGTCAEYDWTVNPLTEGQTPLRPASLYGSSKNAVREMLEAWAPHTGISWAWGRLFGVFGPYEKPQRLIPKTIAKLLEGKPVPFDPATSLRDFMDIRDAADAFATLFDSPLAGAINIADGRPVSIRSVLNQVGDCLGARHLLRFGELAVDQSQPAELTANTRRLNEELGWVSSHSLAERLAETSQWWRVQLSSKEGEKNPKSSA
jgi:nucleoside-diphosphate-sugar epimerase